MRSVLTHPDKICVLGERDLRAAGPGEARIRVRAFSLNRGELRFATNKAEGSPIGWDLAGELEDGTRVVGFSRRMEGWAEEVVLPEGDFAPLPEEVSFSQACALPVAAGTALACLDALGANLLGHRVLVTGVTGGVGGFAVSLAREAGAEVTAQVRRESDIEYAKGLGAHRVVVTSDGAELGSDASYRLVVDGIGGALLHGSLNALDPDGLAVSYGETGGQKEALALASLYGKGRASLRGLNLYAVSDRVPPRDWLGRLVSLVAQGRLRPDLVERGSWTGIGEAAAALIHRKFRGKAVVFVD
ncbi:MAG: zinc-binding dehydrogenase [Myxococcota bacterium]